MNKIFCIFSAVIATSVLSPTFANSNDVYVGTNINANANTAQNLDICSHHFYAGQAPKLIGNKGDKLKRQSYELCFDGFAVLYSGISRTPIWSAEHLTKERIAQAKTLAREDSFHSESRLPHQARAELSDYTRSGFDRGHLAPNGDMANKSQQFDSFSLANIAPQNGTHNRNIWRMIEGTTRHLANKYGEIYVVTGVVFIGKNIQSIGTGVLVPSHFFKVIYVPSLNQAGVYYSPNTENGNYQVLSLDELNKKTGIMAMPTLPDHVQSQALELPDPTQKHAPTTNPQTPPQDSQDNHFLLSLLTQILKLFAEFLNKA